MTERQPAEAQYPRIDVLREVLPVAVIVQLDPYAEMSGNADRPYRLTIPDPELETGADHDGQDALLHLSRVELERLVDACTRLLALTALPMTYAEQRDEAMEGRR